MLFWCSFFRASLMILLAILVVLNVQFFWKNKCISQIEISEKIQKKEASSHALPHRMRGTRVMKLVYITMILRFNLCLSSLY